MVSIDLRVYPNGQSINTMDTSAAKAITLK